MLEECGRYCLFEMPFMQHGKDRCLSLPFFFWFSLYFFFFFFFTAALFHNCFLCAAENPDSELIARTPLPDGTVEEVYKYTPDDDTPIVVRNPLDVLEKVEVSSLCCCVD